MNDTETAIRNELNIPPEAQHVVILSMDAHMDWDWLQTFQDNLENGSASAQKIIASAFQLVAQYHSDPDPYYYSICEMGFLQAAIELDPELAKDFAERIGDRLRIVGGGMTSPDSLLSHGETFIRNYLLGKVFLDATLGLHF